MSNPALDPDVTPEKRYMYMAKHKRQDSIYNLSEAVDAAQIYYRQAFPSAVPVGREKIRALYIFLFDLIIHSVDCGAEVSLHNFGKFKRAFTPGAKMKHYLRDDITHRRAHYRCVFNPAKRFRDYLNTLNEEEAYTLFAENATTLDMLDKEAREKDAEEELKKELATKWGVPVSVFDELQENNDS
jgi:nucleoid DNA-binding protein